MKIKQIYPNAIVISSGEYLVGAFVNPLSEPSMVYGFKDDSLEAVRVPLEDIVWLRVAGPERGKPAMTQRPHGHTPNAYNEDTGEDFFNAFVCENMIYAYSASEYDYIPITLSFNEVEFRDRIWSFTRPESKTELAENHQSTTLELSKRAISTLKRLDILTLGDMKEKSSLCTKQNLRAIPGCGIKTAREILSYVECLEHDNQSAVVEVEVADTIEEYPEFEEGTTVQEKILFLVGEASDGITAKQIASKLNLPKSEINHYLYCELSEQCVNDRKNRWFIKQKK